MATAAREQVNDIDLGGIREMLYPCIQCGICTASCPNAYAMDVTPRQLWRLVLLDRPQAIFTSQTFMLCSSCYCCTLRCPRGLPLTEAMAALKQIASRWVPGRYRSGTLFYRDFLESVRRHGRVREMELMTLYFMHMKNPLLPLRFASLGIKLMAKGLVPLQLPSSGKGRLDSLFNRVKDLESRP